MEELNTVKSFDWNNKVILIAEDQKVNFVLLKAIFDKTKATVIWAQDGEAAVEVKAKRQATHHDLRGLRAFKEEHRPKRSILVSMDSMPRKTDDGIDILPWNVFLEELWEGKV